MLHSQVSWLEGSISLSTAASSFTAQATGLRELQYYTPCVQMPRMEAANVKFSSTRRELKDLSWALHRLCWFLERRLDCTDFIPRYGQRGGLANVWCCLYLGHCRVCSLLRSISMTILHILPCSAIIPSRPI
ncbi:hypothetical protein BDZ45DRAFT_589 [Acephala macrosclerotiorum]|nr:hypothetical protein BDZ45DRAFT_589 [Acephala macrosclerotiorum]